MVERIVAKIRKNTVNEIWVVLTDYSGELRLDLRERFHSDGGFVPTKKGVAIQLTDMPLLVSALTRLVSATDLGTVATFGRTAKTEIRASLARYQGHSYADIRRFVQAGGSEDGWKHAKGITLNQALVPSLLGAVQDAIEFTRADAAQDVIFKPNRVRPLAMPNRIKARKRL